MHYDRLFSQSRLASHLYDVNNVSKALTILGNTLLELSDTLYSRLYSFN